MLKYFAPDFFSGATVYMVCRNKERGEAALSKIRSTTGNQNVHLEVFFVLHFLSIVHFFLVFCSLCNFCLRFLLKGITTSVNPNMLYSLRLYGHQ